ncbi:rod-binding protein [Metarhizobium album]|uniref:Rod-binding protein n=1 Tax=Metarhizobium album TaxID=2182425 RepID=A0A2U2DWZ8_9HYPH|nr:rod-binding protein [Rhizobium album]PWE57826.1 rod-binding protein [Rhizobium album]
MAISPPSDLVLDVVKAADPAAVQAAQQKLMTTRAAAAARGLTESGAGFSNAIDQLDTTASSAGLSNVSSDKSKIPASYRKFEAMVLQSFVGSMLPESEELYGKGNAGEIWKGMMAEQLGDSIAKAGGVGIAAQMYSQSLMRAQNNEMSSVVPDDNQRKLALSMVTDFERRTFGVVATDNEGAENS